MTVVSEMTSDTYSRRSSHGNSSQSKRAYSLRESQIIHDSRVLKRSLSTIPLAKLDWSKVGLVGRQKELAEITDMFQNTVWKENGPSAITLSGPGGVGKSSLAQQALKSILLLGNSNKSNKSLSSTTSLPNSNKSASTTSTSSSSKPFHSTATAYTAIGKWSLTATDEPLSILRSIVDALGDQIISTNNVALMNRILKEFEGQTDALEWWMPSIVEQEKRQQNEGLDNNTTSEETAPTQQPSYGCNDGMKTIVSDVDNVLSSSSVTTNTTAQLRYATTSILALMDRPVVIIADDIQWADATSLDLLKGWSTDPLLKHIMIVTCYRSDEVSIVNGDDESQEHIVNKAFLIPLKDTLVDVSVGPLTIDQTLEVVTQLFDLKMTSETTAAEKFAELLYKNTRGNPFYLVSFIQSLVEEALLTFDLSSMKWTWDLESVKEATSVTDNVVDMVKNTLTNSMEARSLLPIAAILGAMFTKSLLWTVCSSMSEDNNLRSENFGVRTLPKSSWELTEWLKECEDNGFLFYISKKKGGGGSDNSNEYTYKFVHDRIQEAALALLPPDKLSQLKLEIGRVLVQMVTDERGKIKTSSSDFLVFTAVNLLDDSNAMMFWEFEETTTKSLSRLSLIRLNQTAGDRSLSKSYFGLANKYFDAAVNLLNEKDWREQSQLCAEVYSGAAAAGYGAGASEWMTKYADIVLSKDKTQLLDKVPVFHTKIQYLLSTERTAEAISLTLELLNKLGIQFPKNTAVITFKTLAGLLRSKKRLQKLDIQKLPTVEDGKENAIHKTLDVLSSAAYHGKPELIPLAILSLFSRTRRVGLTRWSAPAFSLLGLLMAGGLEDFASAKTCYTLSLAAQKVVSSTEMEARLIFLNSQYLVHWFSAQQNILRPLNQAYRVGLLNGDIESSAWCICFHHENALQCGRPLALVQADCATYSSQMSEYSMHKQRRYLNWQWQAIRNLMGSDESVAALSGGIVTEEEEIKTVRENKDRAMELGLCRVRMFLATCIGDYQTCADLALDTVDEAIKRLPAQPANCRARFNAGVAGFIMAQRRPHQKKYKRLGTKNASVISSWSRKGNPNCLHLDAFLDAEKARTDSKTNASIKSYESAIVLAGRQGFIHDQALAAERYADLLLELGWKDQAVHQMRDAMKWYQEWGATSKVNQLESQLSSSIMA